VVFSVKETDETQAKRLFPYIREILHSDDELTILGNKIYPKIEDNLDKGLGKGVRTEAVGLLRQALRAAGIALLALFAFNKWWKP
jgi:hypothetical protein